MWLSYGGHVHQWLLYGGCYMVVMYNSVCNAVQIPKAPQQPRVLRHSAAASEADTTSAAAALEARLAPSSAQLANTYQSQNIDPNPWGPPAHALNTHSLQQAQAKVSHSQPAAQVHECDPHSGLLQQQAASQSHGRQHHGFGQHERAEPNTQDATQA